MSVRPVLPEAAPLPPKIVKLQKKMARGLGRKRKLNRSRAGSTALFILMGICGVFMALPLVMIVNNALKPLDELYQFPPRIFVRNPSLSNFSDLFVLMNESWIPFSRYVLNTVIITLGGMLGHVLVASMAAYPLAKNKFPGRKLLFSMVVLSMMFSWTVTQIPQYLIISWLGINNTYGALILPAWSFGMGLYLMKQFMEQLPDSLIESARLQGAGPSQSRTGKPLCRRAARPPAGDRRYTVRPGTCCPDTRLSGNRSGTACGALPPS